MNFEEYKITQYERNEIKDEVKDFSSGQSETIQTGIIENNRWDNKNIKQIDDKVFTNDEFNKLEETNKPFYLNWYFLISISVISLSLIYYYWDNISDLIEKIKILNLMMGIIKIILITHLNLKIFN